MSDRQLTPIEIAEQPWEDPLDGLLSGTYRAPADVPDGVDHLVVYIRGAGGNSNNEYRGARAICGKAVRLWPKLERIGDSCDICVRGISRAFREARAAMASTTPVELG